MKKASSLLHEPVRVAIEGKHSKVRLYPEARQYFHFLIRRRILKNALFNELKTNINLLFKEFPQLADRTFILTPGSFSSFQETVEGAENLVLKKRVPGAILEVHFLRTMAPLLCRKRKINSASNRQIDSSVKMDNLVRPPTVSHMEENTIQPKVFKVVSQIDAIEPAEPTEIQL